MTSLIKLPFQLYHNKYSNPLLPPPDSLLHKTVLITGSNTGLGLATALHCLNLGASTAIITSRSTTRGLFAKQYLETHTTNKSGIVKVMYLDMLTFDGVTAFVKRVKEDVNTIDVIYLNAGVQNMKGEKNVSPEGWEVSLQVNLLSTALLAILLVPWMKTAGRGQARLAFTGSGLHRAVKITPESGWPQSDVFTYWGDPANVRKVGGVGMMSRGKLMLQYVMREIASLVRDENGGPQVIVSSMCPAGVKTELGRDIMSNPVLSVLGNLVLSVVMKPVEEGAKTLVYAALLKPEENGKYFTFYQSEEDYLKATYNNIHGPEGQKMQKIVWTELVDLLGERVPEVLDIVQAKET